MRASETYDRKHKIASKRNGPLGAIGVDVLRELMRMIDFKTAGSSLPSPRLQIDCADRGGGSSAPSRG